MKQLLCATALALLLSGGSAAAHEGDDWTGPLGMMGGSCPMMGMGMTGNGQGMMMGSGQTHMGQGMGQGMMTGQGMMMGQHQMGAMVEGRLAYLKTQLAITDDQSTAWQAYADAARERVEAMQQHGHEVFDAMQSGSAIERMEARIEMMSAMAESITNMLPATKEFYAALDADQKQLADQLIGMDCGAM